MSQYSVHISGTAPALYPTDTFFALLYYTRSEALEVPKLYPYSGEWGQVLNTDLLLQNEYPMPRIIDMVWLSITERTFYSLQSRLPFKKMESLWLQTDEKSGEELFENIVIGMAPYGGVAVWTNGFKKSVNVAWMHAEETHVEMRDFMPLNPIVTLDDNCDFYINNDPKVKENLEKNGLPPRDLFDRYMQQFSYRYVVEFGHWDEENEGWKPYEEDEVKPELDYIEEALYDGTHDKLHDGGLMDYHQAGKPKKQALQWHIKKSEYTAYLWFDDMKIRAAFEAFYHDYPEAEMDFSFRIDPQKNKYQILFNCRDAEQPIPLNESAYQMIVFKSKFEYYRSNNYSQPRGAWIW